jgi:putative ABC transport system permease protein
VLLNEPAGMRRWLENLSRDLRYGLRLLLKQPGFTATAVLALAIAIGANVALFSVVNAVFRPLPYPDADKLMMVWKLRFPGGGLGASPVDFLAWRNQNQSFQGMAAFVRRTLDVSGQGEPMRVEGVGVSPDFFALLGVQSTLGHLFQPQEGVSGGTRAALISTRFWRNWLHVNSDVIGSAVTLSGERYTIVGVLPASFSFMNTPVDVFVPLILNPNGTDHSLTVLAKLRPGATREQAEAE